MQPQRTYDYRKVATVGDTNAMGNVYFVEYFALQGTVRELWVRDCVANGPEHLLQGLVLSTKTAHCEYRKPFYLFETIVCRMHFEEVRQVSMRLAFEFFADDLPERRAFGWQVVVFKDKERRTCRAPDDFVVAAKSLLWAT